MKTTLELPDRLFIQLKAVAARRRTTMKAVVEHALRREIADSETPGTNSPCELNEYGFPVMKKRAGTVVTSERVYQLMDEEGI